MEPPVEVAPTPHAATGFRAPDYRATIGDALSNFYHSTTVTLHLQICVSVSTMISMKDHGFKFYLGSTIILHLDICVQQQKHLHKSRNFKFRCPANAKQQ
jgi:hypothetical protein